MLKESNSPWINGPPSIYLHGVSLKFSVACINDSLYVNYVSWTLTPGTTTSTPPVKPFLSKIEHSVHVTTSNIVFIFHI